MTNPVSKDRELARMLVNKCDALIDMFHTSLYDIIGEAADLEPIDPLELKNNIETINGLRNLRAAIIAGHTGTLMAAHRNSIALLLEISLDMES